MTPDAPRERAAARILALARAFAARSRDFQIRLIEEFEEGVREHAAVLGPLTIEDADDEQLLLGADGRFQGRVLVTTDGASSWEVIREAADVIDHYDPVDLFADLSDALDDEVPSADGPDRPATSTPADATAALDSTSALDPTAEPETATRRILRDLHDAGVYSDADYAARLAELDKPPGG